MAKDCFAKKRQQEQAQDKSSNFSKPSKFKPHSNSKGRVKKDQWKYEAPKSGANEEKEVNGRTFNWCQKCGRWSTTHSTATHQSKSPSQAAKTVQWEDPSCWKAQLDDVNLVMDDDNNQLPMQFDWMHLVYLSIITAFFLHLMYNHHSDLMNCTSLVWQFHLQCFRTIISGFYSILQGEVSLWLNIIPRLQFLGAPALYVGFGCTLQHLHTQLHEQPKETIATRRFKTRRRLLRTLPLRLRNDKTINMFNHPTPSLQQRRSFDAGMKKLIDRHFQQDTNYTI